MVLNPELSLLLLKAMHTGGCAGAKRKRKIEPKIGSHYCLTIFSPQSSDISILPWRRWRGQAHTLAYGKL